MSSTRRLSELAKLGGDFSDRKDLSVLDSPRGASIHGSGIDLLGKEGQDAALTAKMHLVNNALDDIGFTGYHWKLLFLNGFGYAVDSLVLLLQSVIAGQAALEFQPSFSKAMTISVYVGMFTGALFWGLGADVIGRKLAFNVSLFICAAFTIIAGAAPNWVSLGVFISLIGFGAGGNLILDTAVFIEYLPSSKQWVLTWLACFWGVGQLVTGLFAWAFLVKAEWNCATTATCTYDNNKGWRYVMYTSGAFVFVLSVLRVTVIRLNETPKFLLGEGKDEKVVELFQKLARKYNRPCSITLDQLTAHGVITGSHGRTKLSIGEYIVHFRGLFESKRIALSTILIWFSWTLIGLAYPLFYVFLGTYLAARVRGTVTADESWRNYALTNFSSIWGPMLASLLANWRPLGRKWTMVIGALLTMIFFFVYPQVTTQAQNLGISCAIAFAGNIYYGTLYAYTPEVLPSAHRATGNGIAVAFNRVMGIVSALIGEYADTSSTVPIYILAALWAGMAAVAVCFPFEPYGKRSS